MLPYFNPWQSLALATDITLASQGSEAALAERRARRLAALLDTAVHRTRLYPRLYAALLAQGRPLADWRLTDLPVLRKAELMRHFDEALTDPALHHDDLRRLVADPSRIAEPYLGRYAVWESSGSRGEPCLYVQDTAAMAVYDALEALRRPTLGAWPPALNPWAWNERIAFVGATGGHFASTVSVERLRRLNVTLAGRLCSVSFLQPLDRLVAELQALAPTVLATYPSTALLLAEECVAGRLSIAPREIWTGGETLSPAMHQTLTQLMGCPVINSYGASEFLAIATECRHGGLHLNSDWVILEPVDDHGQPVPAGQPGATTLLTNLANQVQPLLRFDIGDRVTLLGTTCACGSALPLIDVQGRSDDILRLSGAHRRRISISPLALTTVLEDDAGLFDFQLVQQGPSELLLRTGLRGRAAQGALRRGRQALQAYLARQGAGPVRIHCHSAQPGRPGRSGKVQRVLALPARGHPLSPAR